jgi:hypothetical protein
MLGMKRIQNWNTSKVVVRMYLILLQYTIESNTVIKFLNSNNFDIELVTIKKILE